MLYFIRIQISYFNQTHDMIKLFHKYAFSYNEIFECNVFGRDFFSCETKIKLINLNFVIGKCCSISATKE